MFNTECPCLPAFNASREDKENYEKWIKVGEMAKCYILVAVSNVLQHQHQSSKTAADVVHNLKEMFGVQG